MPLSLSYWAHGGPSWAQALVSPRMSLNKFPRPYAIPKNIIIRSKHDASARHPSWVDVIVFWIFPFCYMYLYRMMLTMFLYNVICVFGTNKHFLITDLCLLQTVTPGPSGSSETQKESAKRSRKKKQNYKNSNHKKEKKSERRYVRQWLKLSQPANIKIPSFLSPGVTMTHKMLISRELAGMW